MAAIAFQKRVRLSFLFKCIPTARHKASNAFSELRLLRNIHSLMCLITLVLKSRSLVGTSLLNLCSNFSKVIFSWFFVISQKTRLLSVSLIAPEHTFLSKYQKLSTLSCFSFLSKPIENKSKRLQLNDTFRLQKMSLICDINLSASVFSSVLKLRSNRSKLRNSDPFTASL